MIQQDTRNPEVIELLAVILKDDTHIRDSTKATYEALIEKFAAGIDKPVDQIVYADVSKFLQTFKTEFYQTRGEEPSLGHMNNVMCAVKYFFSRAERFDLIKR